MIKERWSLGGYAPGGYLCNCLTCSKVFDGDKRAVTCLPCAAPRAAERITELSDALEEASNAMRMTALAMEAPMGRPTKRHVQHWTALFHAESQKVRRVLGLL